MFATETVTWFREGQHLFNDQIVSHLEAIKQGHALVAYLGLTFIGFLYGIAHAVGPGHGKAVVSSYVLANENSLKRGLLIVALSSLLQAVTAVVIVIGFFNLLAVTRAGAEHMASLLETGSFVLIAFIGVWLIVQGLGTLYQAFNNKETSHQHHGHHDHHHDHSCGCGHAHMPAPDQIKGKKNTAALAVMIFSIGIRPCTGALLLLFFACMFDLAWAGAVATFAMAVGTAITTGLLALLAVKSKKLALSLVKKSDRGLLLTHGYLRLFGGAIILLTAGLFMAAQIGGEASAGTSEQHPLYKTFR